MTHLSAVADALARADAEMHYEAATHELLASIAHSLLVIAQALTPESASTVARRVAPTTDAWAEFRDAQRRALLTLADPMTDGGQR